MRPLAQRNDGAWSLPDGDADYAWCARRTTTTNLTPAEIHELGLAEVARVTAELDALLRAQGLVEGSVGTRLARLSQDPAQLFPNTAEGRKALLEKFQAILDDANRGLGHAFDVRPKLGVEVRPVPESSQNGAAVAYYVPGSFDGSRPATSMRTCATRARCPGSRCATTPSTKASPDIISRCPLRRSCRAFRSFARSSDSAPSTKAGRSIRSGSPSSSVWNTILLDSVGRLRWEMLRAVRLAVDTGIHDKRWTREQAIDYMIEKTGKDEAFATSKIERYFVDPGQALAYKVGMEKILTLREKARMALGPKFDLAQFHDKILIHGSLPLVVLERVIDDWIASVKAA